MHTIIHTSLMPCVRMTILIQLAYIQASVSSQTTPVGFIMPHVHALHAYSMLGGRKRSVRMLYLSVGSALELSSSSTHSSNPLATCVCVCVCVCVCGEEGSCLFMCHEEGRLHFDSRHGGVQYEGVCQCSPHGHHVQLGPGQHQYAHWSLPTLGGSYVCACVRV